MPPLKAKDIAASAMLICASAVVIGSHTFWPYLLARAVDLRARQRERVDDSQIGRHRTQAATARPPRRSSSQTMIEPLSRFQASPLAKAAR
jgi:hypothetical protein